MTRSHWASLILSILAFGLFVINVFYEMAGWGALDLRGPFGAAILTGFLAAGLLIQVSKFLEGHKNKVDIIFTMLLLPAHIAAELTIWIRTQILHWGLPPELPFYIVGLYWAVGLLDVLAPRIGPEISKLRPSYENPEKENARLKQENALLMQRLSITKEMHEQEEALKSTLFVESCQVCGVSFEKRTATEARNALNGHINRKHTKTVEATQQLFSAVVQEALPSGEISEEPKSP